MELCETVIEGLKIAGNGQKIPDHQFSVLLNASMECLLVDGRLDSFTGLKNSLPDYRSTGGRFPL